MTMGPRAVRRKKRMGVMFTLMFIPWNLRLLVATLKATRPTAYTTW